MENNTVFRYIEYDDVDKILAGFAEQGWSKPRYVIEEYAEKQMKGSRIVLIAEVKKQIAGYITLLVFAQDAIPFIERKIPEIKDFNVFEKYQNQGLGGKLLGLIEEEGAKFADEICLGVGMYAGYGQAQRLYIKNGYIPDGTGIWSGNTQVPPYEMICNDDDLVLYLSKKLGGR